MSSKRKVQSLGLERRVRPRREEKWQPEAESEDEQSADDGPVAQPIEKADSDSDDDDDEKSEPGSSDGSDSESDEEDEPPKVDLSSVSFGALARAQASLKSKPSKSDETSDSEPNNTLFRKEFFNKASKTPVAKRSSKHAPQEQTSKRPVSRMREIIPDTRRKARDPRFDPSVSRIGKLDEAKVRKAYSFLDDYRDSEMADLRVEIKKTKDEYTKEKLKRQLMSMESKKKARVKKDDEEKLLEEHRRKEKDMVAQGKTPFYLKKSEQKKQLLLNRYEKMSKGQVDRAIERKRKKVSGKEKKEMGQLERRGRS